jgi:hypothetical protein
MFLHRNYGTWFRCKFVIVFENIILHHEKPKERKDIQYISPKEANHLRQILNQRKPNSEIQAHQALSHGNEFIFPPEMLLYHYPGMTNFIQSEQERKIPF